MDTTPYPQLTLLKKNTQEKKIISCLSTCSMYIFTCLMIHACTHTLEKCSYEYCPKSFRHTCIVVIISRF